MSTLRQKVDAFCKSVGGDSDKLEGKVEMLKAEMKKLKDTHKHELHLAKAAAKAAKPPKVPKAKTRKLTEEEKGQQKREKAVTKELAKAAKAKAAAAPKQVVAMNPLPPSPVVASGGRRTRRRY